MSKERPQNPRPMTFAPEVAVSFDPQAFDDLIRTQGVEFVHFRAMRCPVGLVDRYDIRRPHEDHAGCSNGFLYTKAGLVTCGFLGNSTQPTNFDSGWMDGSTVQVTSPRFYDNSNEPVQFAPFDRLYLSEEAITVPHWQLVEHHITGRDKLSFPAVRVVDLVDTEGLRYEQGTDFQIVNGHVVWGARRPKIDPETGKGVIYAVRFQYRPYWYIKNMVHEVRVAQIQDPISGVRRVERMPQACVLQREYVFEKEDRDAKAPNPSSPRQVAEPGDGSFGPR